MTKKELLDNLVADVLRLWRKDVVESYEVNQAEHIRWEFEELGALPSYSAAFIDRRTDSESARHPDALVRVYADFRDKWNRLEHKENEQ